MPGTVLIILAHPDKGSFNHAVANACASRLEKGGCRVVLHDLYAEGFDPVLPAAEIKRGAELDDAIRRHCEDLLACDGIVIVHPNWWGMPPAILTGWVDRVIRPGMAYKFVEGDKGEGVPVGLLKAKSAVVFNTSNTEAGREERVFGDPLEAIWKKCVFGLCSIDDVERRVFRIVVTSSAEAREKWLLEAADLVARKFA
jgi:putative NADPH-quinone reductase